MSFGNDEPYWKDIQNISKDPNHLIPSLFQKTRRKSLPALEAFLNKSRPFKNSIIQRIANLALEFPTLFPLSVPILQSNSSLTLSQQQIGCILAAAFFCAFDDLSNGCPSINFDTLYKQSPSSSIHQKLECLFHYFDRITSAPIDDAQRTVTYYLQRVAPLSKEDWICSRHPLVPISLHSSGTIEEQGPGMLQLDFANKCIGGGVLTHGLVQEEILFLIKPECIASRLFTPMLRDDQALFIVGAGRYSAHEGYRSSFRCTGDYRDETPRDGIGRRRTEIVAMDAIDFSFNPSAQFSQSNILRELNKALAGFTHPGPDISVLSQDSEIATGNWGCGAFSGDPELKFLIQWVAASRVGRPVSYLTFGDQELCNRGTILASNLICSNVSTGQIVDALISLGEFRRKRSCGTFDFLEHTLMNNKNVTK